jgi:hypothetical protein
VIVAALAAVAGLATGSAGAGATPASKIVVSVENIGYASADCSGFGL